MNPCQYSVATFKSKGIGDIDLVQIFANMIRHKVKTCVANCLPWPYSPDELLDLLDKGAIKELYNVIYAMLDKKLKLDAEEYAITSQQVAIKIWSMPSDWESLLTKSYTAKQIVTGTTLHRMTGRKEATKTLHNMNNCISYDDKNAKQCVGSNGFQSRKNM